MLRYAWKQSTISTAEAAVSLLSIHYQRRGIALKTQHLGRAWVCTGGCIMVALMAWFSSAALAAPPNALELGAMEQAADASSGKATELLEVQARAGRADLAESLQNRLGEEYAGIWFDPTSGEYVVLLTSRTASAAVIKEMAAVHLSGYFRSHLVMHSWRDLITTQHELDARLGKFFDRDLVFTSIDPRTNSVVLHVGADADPADGEALERIAEPFGDLVEIESEPERRFSIHLDACSPQPGAMNCSTPFRGGVEIAPTESPDLNGGICTAGFRALGSNGQRYVLTAGHCAIKDQAHPNLTDIKANWKAWDDQQLVANNYWGEKHYLGQVEQISFPAHDWMKVNATGTYWDSGNAPTGWPSHVVYWPANRYDRPAINEEVPMNSEAKSITGQTVCHSGIASGTTCGQVVATNVTYDVGEDGQLGYNLVRVKGGCYEGGDSGGPYFAANTAYGMHIGSEDQYHPCSTYAYYHEITEASAALGVKVAPQLPMGETLDAANVQSDRALLNGTVNPRGLGTTYRFDYGRTTAYGSATASASVGSGESTVPVSSTVDGLQLDTTYHFRLVANNSFGTSYGVDRTFTTMGVRATAVVDLEGRSHLYYRAANDQLQEWYQSGSLWKHREWGAGGSVAGKPAALLGPEGKIFVYYRTPGGQLKDWWFKGSEWGQETWGSTGSLGGDPAAFVDSEGKRFVYYRDATGQLEDWWFKGAAWGQESWGFTGAVEGTPSAFVDSEGKRFVYYRTPGNQLKDWWFKGSEWGQETWGSTGSLGGDPAAFVDPEGKRFVYYRDSTGQLEDWWFKGTGWGQESWGFTSAVEGTPSAFVDSEGKRFVYYRSTNGQLQSWWFKGTGWGQDSWGNAGALGASPTAIPTGVGQRDVFYFDSQAWPYLWGFNGGAWDFRPLE